MNRILDYVEAVIKFHQDNGYETDYDTAFYCDDFDTCVNKMYDVGSYETLLQIKKKIEEVIKNEK